ncbi:ferredoxin nitrite reductase [Tribonema minus]|uniref:Ferredoxin--nitrite reductase, chloroplastic n=1 Tax=Tribonema minus TaxID=303371 RepID=A0A836CEB3_9STRA|nr:ferredoxin nitrite reductase [Tribonema minus]
MRATATAVLALYASHVAAFLAPQMSAVQKAPVTAPAQTPSGTKLTSTPVTTSNDFLSADALERARSGNKWEKVKLNRAGDLAFQDVQEWAAAVRSGELTWEQLDVDDADIRLKWAGLFHRRKRHPGTFMMRMKMPNGIVTSDQLRFCADAVAKYDPSVGVIDITTRQALQLRGVTLEDADRVIEGARAHGLCSYLSGADNTRNIVGSPIAGIDPQEIIDTRALCTAINHMIVGRDGASPAFANLPRKFNIAVSGSRDDFAHTHINDLGLVPVADASGRIGFNIVVGGFFSAKRADISIPLGLWVPADAAVALCRAVLELYRDGGARKDRQKNRLMYLVEQRGVEAFRDAIAAALAAAGVPSADVRREIPEPSTPFARRSVLGVHAQAQPGLSWVGVHVPVGRLTPETTRLLADFADAYSGGEARLTVEQDVIFPNVKDADLEAMRVHPLFGALPLEAGALSAGTVACTGATYCGFGLMVTKERAVDVNAKLEARLHLPRPVRIHWTGCPNSCGQAQIGDIALMGSVAKVDGKTVEGCDIFLGGTIGEHAKLAEKVLTRIPTADDHLLPVLEGLLIEHFGATLKAQAA